MPSQDTQIIDAIFKLSRMMRDSSPSRSTNTQQLSMLQIQALVFLKKHKNAQMGQIAAQFGIELPSATSLVNKLVNENLATRKNDKKDRRLVCITITSKGEQLLKQARDEKTKRIKENLSHLSLEDKVELLRIIDKMIIGVEKNK